jgi:branched-chain amino acid transport system ATP-binding protein
MTLLEVTDLVVRYGGVNAVRNVSLQVQAGEAVAVLGPNGAGKSTLLRAISGLVRPAEGSIRLAGRDMVGQPVYRISRAGFVHVPEGRAVIAPLSVEDNLRIGGHHLPRRAVSEGIEQVLQLFPMLRPHLRSTAGLLSGGEQQMLAIARGLMARPTVLAIDEPSMGLAPVVVQSVLQTLQGIGASGTALLLAEQNARLALDAAHRAYILVNGEVVRSGPSLPMGEEIIENYLS